MTRPQKAPAILALDPGDTTGWCLFRLHGDDWELRMHGMSRKGVPELDWGNLVGVIVEGLPQSRGSSMQERAHQEALQLAAAHNLPIHEVLPANWKPWAKAGAIAKEALDPEMTPRQVFLKSHALDAYCLGRYVLWRFYGGKPH